VTTPEPMSAERLAEIRQREQAAPKGPWRIERHEPSLCNYILSEGGELEIGLGYVGNHTEAEGNFIVHARQDVPDLLAEVDRLRAELTNIGIYHRKHNCDGNIPEDCGCADARRDADGGEVCGHCQWPWPCLTLNLVNRALGGAK
jgi:hypothetical protein